MLQDEIRLLEKKTGLESKSTRRTLLIRLVEWDDTKSWQEFFDCYWRLIYSVARQAGLNNEEAQDVVQETVFSVAKQIGRFEYRPEKSSFKAWLLTLTRRRIADQFRKRRRNPVDQAHPEWDSRETPLLDRLADSSSGNFDELWEEEWEHNLLKIAIERVKRRCNPTHFAVFHLVVARAQRPKEAAKAVGVNIAQVYLAKHRVTALLKQEVKRLRAGGY